ncbi:MAG: hypothetical protein WB783_07500, partial [Arenicellales bacterium]
PSSKRRDALRKLAVTGGVIGTARTWTKPVVDSVVLPAHALTSDPLGDPCTGLTVLSTSGDNFNVKVTGAVTGSGNANISVTVKVQVGATTHQQNVLTDSNGNYMATVGSFPCSGGSLVQVTASLTNFPEIPAVHCSTTVSKKDVCST